MPKLKKTYSHWALMRFLGITIRDLDATIAHLGLERPDMMFTPSEVGQLLEDLELQDIEEASDWAAEEQKRRKKPSKDVLEELLITGLKLFIKAFEKPGRRVSPKAEDAAPVDEDLGDLE